MAHRRPSATSASEPESGSETDTVHSLERGGSAGGSGRRRRLSFRVGSSTSSSTGAGAAGLPTRAPVAVRLRALARRVARWQATREDLLALCGVALASLVYYALFWRAVTPLALSAGLGAPEAPSCSFLAAAAARGRARGAAAAAAAAAAATDKPRIAIVTFLSGLDPDVVRLSMANKRRYAELHGYELLRLDDEVDGSRQAPWSKFLILHKHLDAHDYLVWLDADALVSDLAAKVEDIVGMAPGKDLYYAADELDINSGVFIVRNSAWSKWYLVEAWQQRWLVTDYNFRSTHEQRAIHYLHGAEDVHAEALAAGRAWPYPRLAEVREHTMLVPHCALNSNVCEEFWTGFVLWRRSPSKGRWCDNVFAWGNFIVHLAGKSPASYKKWLFETFASRIEARAEHQGLPPGGPPRG